MATVHVSEDDRSLSDLVERAELGETVQIARHGRVVAKLVPVEERRRRIDFDALHQLRASSPMSAMTVEEMRRLDLL